MSAPDGMSEEEWAVATIGTILRPRPDGQSEVWDGEKWLLVVNPDDDDRRLAAILRRFIADSGNYADLRGDEVVLDGYVTTDDDADTALIQRLMEGTP